MYHNMNAFQLMLCCMCIGACYNSLSCLHVQCLLLQPDDHKAASDSFANDVGLGQNHIYFGIVSCTPGCWLITLCLTGGWSEEGSGVLSQPLAAGRHPGQTASDMGAD